LPTARKRIGVFVNCPFDDSFKPLFDSISFAIAACGFQIRSALEVADSGELRLEKIYRLIEECDFSIHDLSRIELDAVSGLPRFNMPIELGIALGFKRFSRRRIRPRILVLDSERYRYQTFASDLAGLDISAHSNQPKKAIALVRNFLAHDADKLPSPSAIEAYYLAFEDVLPTMATAMNQRLEELTFVDRLRHSEYFLDQIVSGRTLK
jgi:hypothetical protein